VIGRIAGESRLTVQVGGGIRDEDTLRLWFDTGVARVVIGSLAVTDTARVLDWIDRFGAERIVLALDVSIDEKGSPVLTTHGWTRSSGIGLRDCLDRYAAAGLRQAEQLPEPIFTPSTKADIGAHDENIDFDRTVALIGREPAEQMRDISLRIYSGAAAYARERGIIIADTKFEFGLDSDGNMVLIDEVLTPDSSRFWPLDGYRTGISPPSFDKQYVRDYLETLDWNKTPPGPRLPREVIDNTAKKYLEAQQRLTEVI